MKHKTLWCMILVGILLLSACNSGSGSRPTADVTRPPLTTPTASPDAERVLVEFAQQQLGIVIKPIYAGNATDKADALLKALPPEIQSAMNKMPDLATQSYWGLLGNGVATVNIGECAAGAVCTVGGENELELNSASLGIYVLRVSDPTPTDADAALALVQQTFPGLKGLSFSPVENEEIKGYAFYVLVPGVDLGAGQAAIAAKSVIAGTTDVNGKTVVYAAVGLGVFSSSLGLFR